MSNLDDDVTARVRSSLNRGVAPELSPDLVSGAAAHPAPRLSNPGRTLRVAGGAGLVVAAVTVGALVVTPTLSRPPLFTAAAGGSTAAALGTEDGVSSDSMKIGWWVDYNYSAGSGLSTDGGSGQVYQLVMEGDPQQRADAIADIFGVDGAVTEASYSDDAYPTWVVGPEDGSAPVVTVTWSGTGDWWFNDPTASPFYVCDVGVTAEESAEYGCILPADAPENLAPSEDEARVQAQQLLATTGLEVNADDITTYSDDWGTTATANLVVDGVETALDWTINWSNSGEIAYAYGHSVSVQARGSYGTVSAVDAVNRLEDYRWWGSAGPDYQGGAVMYAADATVREGDTSVSSPGSEVIADDATSDDTTEPSDGTDSVDGSVGDPGATPEPAPVEEPTVDPAPVEEPSVEPVPIDPIPAEEPTPEVVEVTVDKAEATLLLMWDADGNAWLVPGFAMQVDDGWWSPVVSLVEGVIVLPEPIEVEPMILEQEITG